MVQPRLPVPSDMPRKVRRLKSVRCHPLFYRINNLGVSPARQHPFEIRIISLRPKKQEAYLSFPMKNNAMVPGPECDPMVGLT